MTPWSDMDIGESGVGVNIHFTKKSQNWPELHNLKRLIKSVYEQPEGTMISIFLASHLGFTPQD